MRGKGEQSGYRFANGDMENKNTDNINLSIEDKQKYIDITLVGIFKEVIESSTYKSVSEKVYTEFEDFVRKINEYKDCDLTIILPILYQLIFRPAYDMKKSIELEGKIDDAVVAVYGAVTNLAKKRVTALNDLIENVSLDNGVILSGGHSWTGIRPTEYWDKVKAEYMDDKTIAESMDRDAIKRIAVRCTTKDEDARIEVAPKYVAMFEKIRAGVFDNEVLSMVEEFKNDEKGRSIWENELNEVMSNRVTEKISQDFSQSEKSIFKKALSIVKEVPQIRAYLHDRDAKIWNDLLEEERAKYEKEGKSTDLLPKNYDEAFEEIVTRNVGKIKSSEKKNREYYEIYCEKQKETNGDSTEINQAGFDAWLFDRVVDEYRAHQVMYSVTEAEIMDVLLSETQIDRKALNVFLDIKATHSGLNAVNTVNQFIEWRKTNPKLKRIVVVSNWQYLLRQVLATKKAAIRAGLNDIEIMGYPADEIDKDGKPMMFDDENRVAMNVESASAFIRIVLGELFRIEKYSDCADMQIQYSNKGIDDGPIVLISGKKLQDYIKEQGLVDKSDSDFESR